MCARPYHLLRARKPIQSALTRWFEHCEQFTTRTQSHYKMVLFAFAGYAPIDVQDLKLEHIEKYLVHLRATGRCNRTINAHLTALKSFCHWLRDYGDIDIPVGKIKMLIEDPPKLRIIDDEQYSKLIAAATLYQANVITFLAHTGLRESEWRSLSWANISPDFKMVCLIGKGRKRRFVPLSQTCQGILRKYKSDSTSMNLSKNFFKFKTRGNLRRMLCAVAKRAHLAPLGSHALRHHFATQVYKKGIPLQLLSKILGHADSRTTERIYVHISQQDLLGLTDVLD